MERKKQPSYAELKKIWYKKLEKSGFVDIEAKETNLRTYRYAGNAKYGQYSRSWQESKEIYYNLASKFLNEHKFSSKLEQVIWEYHTNGISIRNISDTINKTGIKKTNRDAIWKIVKNLRNIMKGMYLKK